MFLQVDITSTCKLLVTSKVKSDMYFVQLFVLLVAFFFFFFFVGWFVQPWLECTGPS